MRPANQNLILDACRAAAAEIRAAAMQQGLELDDEDRRGLFALAALIERKTAPRAMCGDIIDRAVSGMIDLLNALDAPSEDLEPSLGAPERHGSAAWGFGVNRAVGYDQTFWACGGDTDEREDENEHGTEVDDCPRPARTALIFKLRGRAMLDEDALAICRACAKELGAAAVDPAADLTREERHAFAALALAIEHVAAGRAGVASMTASAAKMLLAALEAIESQSGRPA